MNLNTFGDEVFGDPKVLQSYYYGITHFIVGGRCKCNGHSNVCIPSDPENPDSRSICLCKHGTTGDNCETCLPDHWDRRWQRATSENANPCLRKFVSIKSVYIVQYWIVQRVSAAAGRPSAGSMKSCTWRPGEGESVWSAGETETDLIVRSVNQTTTSHPSRMLTGDSRVSPVIVTRQVQFNPPSIFISDQ